MMHRKLGPICLLFLTCTGLAYAEPIADTYREEVGRILGASLTDQEGWRKLEWLTTVIGHRLSGSEGLEQAIAWAHETMLEEGFESRLQKVMVPHWVRGEESLAVLGPAGRELPVLGLGRSVGTPEGGITADAVVVRSYDELEALGREGIEGRIVVYAVPWQGYGKTVGYRGRGASRAAEYGAVASLVRSMTGRALALPHTGAMRYDDSQPRIPSAAIAVEDAEWMARMQDLGKPVKLHLEMGAETLPDAESANVILEIAGREHPEQVVVMGGHYDSWDVGHGAHDDGGPCIAAWQAMRILQKLELQPRRTLRVVFWTNEENGLRGGQTYGEAVVDEVDRHVAAIEMDGGLERPIGFGLVLNEVDPESDDPRWREALDLITEVAAMLEPIDVGQAMPGWGGADIGPLTRQGVPGIDIRTVGEHYFDWHHTEADTIDKIDPDSFRRAVAAFAVMGYVLADMPQTLPRGDVSAPELDR